MLKKTLRALALLTTLITTNIAIIGCTIYSVPALISSNTDQQKVNLEIISTMVTGNWAELKDTLTTNEIDHLKDVKTVLTTIVVITIFALFFLYHTKDHELSETIKFSTASLILIGILITLFFEPFFILFHQILFTGGNWSFPATAILIQLYPETFWQAAALTLISLTLIELLFIKYLHKKQPLASNP